VAASQFGSTRHVAHKHACSPTIAGNGVCPTKDTVPERECRKCGERLCRRKRSSLPSKLRLRSAWIGREWKRYRKSPSNIHGHGLAFRNSMQSVDHRSDNTT
jgi:hypothetical protein